MGNRKYMFSLVVLIVFCLVIFSACTKQKKEKEERIDEIIEKDISDYTLLTEKELEVLAYDNDLNAQLELAHRYDFGKSDKGQDFEQAAMWYQKAAEQNSGEAMCAMGYYYLNGFLGQVDLKVASSYFEKSVEQGYIDGNVGLGRCYIAGFDDVLDLSDSQLDELARSEDGTYTSNDLALYYINKAFAAGTPMGIFYEAYCIENEIGAYANMDYAIELYHKVTKMEELSVYDEYLVDAAYVRLAIIFAEGKSVGQDYEKAMEYLKPATEHGSAIAEYYLGLLFENGYGVDKDYEQAYEWYLKSADQNYAPALNQLGYLYYNGYGVEADIDQTIYYQKLAAMQGYGPAQINLGYLFENGIGVEKNIYTALSYYQMAAEQNQDGAKEAIQRVYKLLNEEH